MRPDIAQAYEDVRSDKSETNWMVLKYESAMKDNLKLAATGSGTIEEMTDDQLGEDEAAYAYVRVRLGNDEYSERTKFVFVVWAGEFSSFRSCSWLPMLCMMMMRVREILCGSVERINSLS